MRQKGGRVNRPREHVERPCRCSLWNGKKLRKTLSNAAKFKPCKLQEVRKKKRGKNHVAK